jgi:hypothetical protein
MCRTEAGMFTAILTSCRTAVLRAGLVRRWCDFTASAEPAGRLHSASQRVCLGGLGAFMTHR